MNFSTFQNRNLYVVKAFKDNVGDAAADPAVDPVHIADPGDIEVKVLDDGCNKDLFFLYQGADTALKSDNIPLKNITYIKAFKASDLRKNLNKVKVTLNSSLGTSGLVNGQNYVLSIEFRPALGLGNEHSYSKSASVFIDSSISSASAFYKAMVHSLNKAFAKEHGATTTSNPYVKFKISYSTSSESEENDSNWSGATATGIIIEELSDTSSWKLGLTPQDRNPFEVFPRTILVNGVETIWAAQDSTTGKFYAALTPSTYIKNGRDIANLEWFCMGERGDQYRMMGWPNYIPTTYMVDPTKEYDVLEIHFAFTDDGTHSYRSEKDITLVADGSSSHSVMNAVIGDINSKTGLSVSTLS